MRMYGESSTRFLACPNFIVIASLFTQTRWHRPVRRHQEAAFVPKGQAASSWPAHKERALNPDTTTRRPVITREDTHRRIPETPAKRKKKRQQRALCAMCKREDCRTSPKS